MEIGKISLAVGGLALLLALAALAMPAKNANAIQESTLDKVLAEGKLRVCYVPYTTSVIKDPVTGKLSGEFVEDIEYIAKGINVEPVYVESDWGTFAADLQSRKCDLSIAATYRTIERASSVAFSRPIVYFGNGAIVKAGDIRFKRLEDFNKKGLKIAVIQGEASQEFAEKNFPKAEIVPIPSKDLTAHFLEVSAGRADVALMESTATKKYAREHPEVVDLFANRPYALTAAGWAMRKDDVELLNFVNTAIDFLETSGKLDEFAEKYNSTSLRQATPALVGG